MLAAVVAAASLAITAWGTYKGAQVADDQLSQSREQNERERRGQAERVTMWLDPTDVVVSNRSWDPVWVSTYFSDKEHRNDGSNKVVYVFWGVVPPCTATRAPIDLVYSKASSQAPEATEWRVEGLHFRTAEGQMWTRTRTGLLSDAPLPPERVREQTLWDALTTSDQVKHSALPDCRTP